MAWGTNTLGPGKCLFQHPLNAGALGRQPIHSRSANYSPPICQCLLQKVSANGREQSERVKHTRWAAHNAMDMHMHSRLGAIAGCP